MDGYLHLIWVPDCVEARGVVLVLALLHNITLMLLQSLLVQLHQLNHQCTANSYPYLPLKKKQFKKQWYNNNKSQISRDWYREKINTSFLFTNKKIFSFLLLLCYYLFIYTALVSTINFQVRLTNNQQITCQLLKKKFNWEKFI